ncbi:hypothetical protein Mapa_009019 [Marchantia paleacea]|nr:hypothetical protein Mapa_009019 [Marchantia paleacea]
MDVWRAGWDGVRHELVQLDSSHIKGQTRVKVIIDQQRLGMSVKITCHRHGRSADCQTQMTRAGCLTSRMIPFLVCAFLSIVNSLMGSYDTVAFETDILNRFIGSRSARFPDS